MRRSTVIDIVGCEGGLVIRHAIDAARNEPENESFAHLYRRYRRSVYRYLLARTPDEATAEDLTAQVFLKALRSEDTFRGEGSYRAWLFSIARNTLANFRAEKARLQIPVAELPDGEDETTSPTTIALALEESDLIWDVVADLPAAQREVVRLRYVKDLSIDEIARFTGRTSGAIRVLLHRSNETLRKRLNAKDLSVILGATGAAASIAIYSIHRQRKRHR